MDPPGDQHVGIVPGLDGSLARPVAGGEVAETRHEAVAGGGAEQVFGFLRTHHQSPETCPGPGIGHATHWFAEAPGGGQAVGRQGIGAAEGVDA